MPEESPNRVKIPRYKDKVIFYENAGGKNSYVVASSYKGIIRLSPNNNAAIQESNNVTPQFEGGDAEMTYTDAIVADEFGALGDGDISQRFIRTSDSEGHFIGIRIGEFDNKEEGFGGASMEFDRLNIRGKMLVEKQLTLYTKARNYTEDKLLIGNTSLPAIADTTNTYIHQTGEESRIKNEDPNFLAWKYDGLHPHVTKNSNGTWSGDWTRLLYGLGGDKRRFSYRPLYEVIGDYIMEALMSLNTLPSGSIHFTPITIEQYAALCRKGMVHNRYKYDNNSKEADPIVRDFLLCDGRAYYTSDFPELARVLYGEKIEFWSRGEDISDQDPGEETPLFLKRAWNKDFASSERKVKHYIYQPQNESDETSKPISYKESWIDGETNEEPFTFRVPDLRGMYIRSVPTMRSSVHWMDESGYDEENERTSTITRTGTWMPDNLPFFRNQEKNSSNDLDQHFHFTHFGSYNNALKSETDEALSVDGSKSITLLNSFDWQSWRQGYERGANCKCGQFQACEVHPYTFYFTAPFDSSFSYQRFSYSAKPIYGVTSQAIRNDKLVEPDLFMNIEPLAYIKPRFKYYVPTVNQLYDFENVVGTNGETTYYTTQGASLDVSNPYVSSQGTDQTGDNYSAYENDPIHIICVPLIKI